MESNALPARIFLLDDNKVATFDPESEVGQAVVTFLRGKMGLGVPGDPAGGAAFAAAAKMLVFRRIVSELAVDPAAAAKMFGSKSLTALQEYVEAMKNSDVVSPKKPDHNSIIELISAGVLTPTADSVR